MRELFIIEYFKREGEINVYVPLLGLQVAFAEQRYVQCAKLPSTMAGIYINIKEVLVKALALGLNDKVLIINVYHDWQVNKYSVKVTHLYSAMLHHTFGGKAGPNYYFTTNVQQIARSQLSERPGITGHNRLKAKPDEASANAPQVVLPDSEEKQDRGGPFLQY